MNILTEKIPPQATKLEEAVLGAIMLEKGALAAVIDILTPESFYSTKHRVIYEAFLSLFNDQHPIDMLTATERLKRDNRLEVAGGPTYLVELTNKVASAANIEYHARIIAEQHMKRGLISMSGSLLKKSYDESEDVIDLIDEAESQLFEVASGKGKRDFKAMDSIMVNAIKKIEAMKEKGGGLIGLSSGFPDLDQVTQGWEDSELTILAARPGMGKTSFALVMALEAAKMGVPVALFSLEMSSIQLGQKLLSVQSELDLRKIRSGDLHGNEWEQLTAASEMLSSLPIYIDDTPGLNILELRAKVRRLKMKHNIGFAVLDYLQLMSGTKQDKGNREQTVSAISRGLKLVAKEVNIPVMALSQLSRAVEIRGGAKRPQLSDLRESGAIEQDADRVRFLYRPEYYDIAEDENGESIKGLCEVIVAKNRKGKLDTVPVRFMPSYTGFKTWGLNDQWDDEPTTTTQQTTIKEGSIKLPDDIPF